MKRSKFSLSHYKLFSCDMGEMIPCACLEVLPGDVFQHSTSVLVRVSPLLAPIMHPVNVRVHHWYVPLRLIWDSFENFITGGPDGMDTTAAPTINVAAAGAANGSPLDYLGMVPAVDYTLNPFSALPLRAYNLIWNEWYRDQDLQPAVAVGKGNGDDNETLNVMQHVCWEKDYFTTARPWPQKGPDVTLPLGESAGFTRTIAGVPTPRILVAEAAGALAPVIQSNVAGGAAGDEFLVDLTTASAASVADLREAFALQRYAEARARYGSRYTEYLRYLGVRSSDARLQRPEYLGGGKQILQFSEVLQTGVTTAGSSGGVGNLKGHGIGAMRSNRYRRYFEEHGLVLSMLSVKPKSMYAQGLPRMWSRFTKEDYYQRELEHIGQQEVLNKEIFAGHASPNGVFGYQDRYDEYRRQESTIAAEFRNSTLDFWHMARIFASAPALNADFVKSTPTKRINAVTTNDVLWIMTNHSIQARRMVSRGGSSFSF